MVIKPKIYQLNSGRYQVSFYNPASKKRMRRKFTSFAQAEAFEEELNTRFVFHQAKYSSVDNVEVWMKRYFELNPNAFIKRLGLPMLDSFIETFGSVPIMSVSQDSLLTWLKELQQARKYSVKTMPNIACGIRLFFQFVVDSKSLALNPLRKIKPLIGNPPKDRTVLCKSEIIDLLVKLKEISPDLIYPVVFLMAHTGCRIGEIFNLKWSDVHFEMGTIQLLRTKNGDDRLLRPSKDVMNYLSSLPKNGENVVLSQYQKPWTYRQYRKQLDKVRKKIKFDKYWSNHSLRHSFATNYLKQGGDMFQLQKILGHKSLIMTVDLYGRIEAQDVFNVSPFNF